MRLSLHNIRMAALFPRKKPTLIRPKALPDWKIVSFIEPLRPTDILSVDP